MTGAQSAAFQAATGHAPGQVSTLIASMLVVLLFMWAAWIVTRVLASLHRGESHQGDLLFAALRVSALIWFALYVVQ